jgi:steroid 5-alpha reductase family enzyme
MGVASTLAAMLGLWMMLASLMAIAWVVEQRTRNSGWIDVVWTCAMGLTGIAGATALSVSNLSQRQLLVSGMVLLWALRLAAHIAQRTTTIVDDPRYAKLRQQWGASASRNMFGLLQAQALLSVPMLLSIFLAASNPAELFTVMDLVGLVLFCTALAGSSISDLQLVRFKQRKQTAGRVCDVGLWAWSRHPNYFFEWLIWLSFAMMALNFSGTSGSGYLALAGPVCMYWLLRYVSGVPPLENHMLEKYGAEYAAYQKRTSVFVPLPPASTPLSSSS